MFQVQEEAQEEGFLLLQRLDLQGAREELLLAVGLVAALPQAEQLEATVDQRQASQQVLLLVAAQAEAAGQVSLETQATEEMVGFTAGEGAVGARLSTTSATLALAETEQTALLLSQPTSNHAIRHC
jgi:hypothetical protein